MVTIQFDVPFDVYSKLPGWNQSALKLAKISPALAHQYRDGSERPTHDALVEGSLLDTMLFDGVDTAKRTHFVMPKADGRAKEGKQAKADAEAHAAANSLIVVNDVTWDRCLKMREAILGHPFVAGLMERCKHQATFQWTDPATDLGCKARTDLYDPRTGDIWDVKTTAKGVNLRDMARSIKDYGYDFQLGFYRLAVGGNGQNGLAFVSKEANEASGSYDVGYALLSKSIIHAAQNDVFACMDAVLKYDPSCDIPMIDSLPKW